jgi:hypothetical protein
MESLRYRPFGLPNDFLCTCVLLRFEKLNKKLKISFCQFLGVEPSGFFLFLKILTHLFVLYDFINPKVRKGQVLGFLSGHQAVEA